MTRPLKALVRERLVTAGMLAWGLSHRPDALWKPARHVLVVGHMRSNTTVLSYILGSHPQIAGGAEVHQAYRGALDLCTLRCRLLRTHRAKASAQCFLDKVLHDRYDLRDDILQRDDVRVLFLLRRPEQTLRSIIAMSRQPGEPAWYADPARVADYYTRRMATMARVAERMGAWSAGARTRLLEAEDFVARPEPALASLTGWLGLTTPLSTRYEVFGFTGRQGAGDRSRNIHSGTVVKAKTDYSDIELPAHLIAQAHAAHANCLETLHRHVDPLV